MTPAAQAILDKPGPVLVADFALGVMPSFMTFARASSATSGTYLDANGSSYTTYSTDAPRFLSGGVKVEPSMTNYLLNSAAPVTQTTASLATGTYCLWVIGSGSATSSAGTATGSGFGAATAGVPNVFTLTVSGTVTVTVAGSLDRFQLELSTGPSTFIVTTGATATRAAEQLYSTSGLLSEMAGTLALDFTLDLAPSGPVVGGFATSAFTDCFYQSIASGQVVPRYDNASLGSVSLTTMAVGRRKAAISYGDGVVAGAVDGAGGGGRITRAAPYPLWAGRFTIGCAPWSLGSSAITGTVHSAKLYRRHFPAANLEAITR